MNLKVSLGQVFQGPLSLHTEPRLTCLKVRPLELYRLVTGSAVYRLVEIFSTWTEGDRAAGRKQCVSFILLVVGGVNVKSVIWSPAVKLLQKSLQPLLLSQKRSHTTDCFHAIVSHISLYCHQLHPVHEKQNR